MSIFRVLRTKISYKFVRTFTIFASILHSLYGLPTEVSIIPNTNKKYGTIPILDPNPLTGAEEFGWKLGVVIVLVLLGGIFAGMFLHNDFILNYNNVD